MCRSPFLGACRSKIKNLHAVCVNDGKTSIVPTNTALMSLERLNTHDEWRTETQVALRPRLGPRLETTQNPRTTITHRFVIISSLLGQFTCHCNLLRPNCCLYYIHTYKYQFSSTYNALCLRIARAIYRAMLMFRSSTPLDVRLSLH